MDNNIIMQYVDPECLIGCDNQTPLSYQDFPTNKFLFVMCLLYTVLATKRKTTTTTERNN